MNGDAPQRPNAAPIKTVPRRGRPPLDEATHRRRVLDAGLKLFLKRGFGGASLDAIAREAGVTKRTIYEVVGDKEALFRAVCNYSSASVANTPFPRVSVGLSLHDALIALSRTLIDHALDPARIALSRMITAESMRFPDLVSEVLDVGRDNMNSRICDVFEQMRQTGAAMMRDPPFAAELFYDIVVGNQGFRSTIGFNRFDVSDAFLLRRLDVFIKGYIAVDA